MNNQSAGKGGDTFILDGKFWRVLDKFSEIFHKISALLLLLIIVSIWYQILGRILHISVHGIVEIGGYLLVWINFFAIAYTLRQKRHIRVDLLLRLMPERIQTIFLVAGNSVCVLFSIVMMWQGMKLVAMFYEIKEVSLILQIPIYFVYLALPTGLSLFGLEAVREIIVTLKKGNGFS